MIVAIAIISVWLAVIGVVVYVGLLRRRTDPTPGTVTLQYRSGTTVTLDATEVERARPSAPQLRRRLPGLMPTAGHVVVPRRRSAMRPIPDIHAMSFDET